MDLFASAGMDLPRASSGAPRRVAPRSLRVPLLAYKVIEEARARAAFAPSAAQRKVAVDYARKAAKLFGKQKEEAVRPVFITEVLGAILGYTTIDPEAPFTLGHEQPIRKGSVDVALGHFSLAEGLNDIVAPFELKGPATHDLDAVSAGRKRSPVQQAWDYANDAPGSRWVLVSNCVEVRLYGYGRGREAYEVFDLAKLDEEAEHQRLWLILSADRFLGGATDDLLKRSDEAYKDVTNRLYLEYKSLRDRLIAYLTGEADGPKLSQFDAIEPAQKILDRILFIAFAQRTDLLPGKLLEDAAKERNKFNPAPYWHNFNSLFRKIDKGDSYLNISDYNGGLFSHDPLVDALVLPDPLAGEVAKLGEWDYRSEVPVTVLGHIFEQSITDIERLKAQATGAPPPAVSKRKREGVVYTPDFVTRFLVERTVGLSLKQRFDDLWQAHGLEAGAEETRERAFWQDYLAALRAFTILDPACGSGAFLVAAFDALAGEYRRATLRLDELGAPAGFDYFDEIVTKNLFGVDLNVESVEITRLSLWLKTARRDHRLQNLEATIKAGDSLVEDADYTARPFVWAEQFPQVFAQGGFDVVIGNPPYVRMELIKPVKPYLEKHFAVAADRADLYAYFFERGVGLLNDGGRLGFISSSTFFRTGSGEKLRVFLAGKTCVESVVDFGDMQVFEGVTTYPAMLTLRRGPAAAGELRFFNVTEPLPADLSQAFDDGARPMPRARLTAGAWRFEDEPLALLRDKIAKGRKTLGEVYGAPLYGIKTGLNEAFVIDTPTRDRLVKADKNSAKLLKPFLRGEDVKRWRVEPEGLWLINTPKGKVNIDKYPAIRDWLLPFRDALEKRATVQEWWELQQAQLAYQGRLGSPKLIWGHFAAGPSFCVDHSNALLNNKCFFLPSDNLVPCVLLNCKVLWFQLRSLARIKRGGYIEAEAQYVDQLPIPTIPAKPRARLAALGKTCTDAARRRFEITAAVRRRILDLVTPDRATPTGKLDNWHELDFKGFLAEVKKSFRADIPLKARAEWEAYLADNAAKVRALTAAIAAAEAEIDTIVYQLFDLNAEEITLLEASLAEQY